MSIQRVPGITRTPVNTPLQTGSTKPLSEPKYTIGVDSELMKRIGYAALRGFFALGAIGLMVTGSGIAIALGVLLFLAVVCTLTRAKDQ
jgi:hypothetical protein